MQLEETLDIIEKFLCGGMSRLALGPTVDVFHGVFKNIKLNIEELQKEEKVSEINIKDFGHTTQVLKEKLIFEPVTGQFLIFNKAWFELMINWSKNVLGETVKDHEVNVQRESEFCLRLLDTHLSLRESTDILRAVSKRLGDLKHWNPPAFEISANFLNYLEDTDDLDNIDTPEDKED